MRTASTKKAKMRFKGEQGGENKCMFQRNTQACNSMIELKLLTCVLSTGRSEEPTTNRSAIFPCCYQQVCKPTTKSYPCWLITYRHRDIASERAFSERNNRTPNLLTYPLKEEAFRRITIHKNRSKLLHRSQAIASGPWQKFKLVWTVDWQLVHFTSRFPAVNVNLWNKVNLFWVSIATFKKIMKG